MAALPCRKASEATTKEQAQFGRVAFTYDSKINDTIVQKQTYDIYDNCVLDDGTVVPQISVIYDYGNHGERKHAPTISIYYENADGSIHVHAC